MTTKPITLGIVGAEGAKFALDTELAARAVIRSLFTPDVTRVVSGACHLGGIDVWAIEEAETARLAVGIFPPAHRSWEFYKRRNIQIAEASDRVVCIAVKALPPSYRGMTFKLCYHCGTDSHIKSGGCWTVKYAKSIGKQGEVIVV